MTTWYWLSAAVIVALVTALIIIARINAATMRWLDEYRDAFDHLAGQVDALKLEASAYQATSSVDTGRHHRVDA